MIRLVIFDLDGTLLNTIADLAASTNHALKQHGYPEHSIDEYRYFVGNGITRLIERSLPKNARQNEIIQKIKKEFVEYYQIHKTDLSKPYRHIPEVLEHLHAHNVLLAVASNKYHQGTQELINHYFGNHLFSVVLGQREQVPTKPDPSVIHEILQTTQISPEETLYVGDSGVDMQTAQNSHVTSVGVTWGFRNRQELEENGAAHIIDTPEEIASLAGYPINL